MEKKLNELEKLAKAATPRPWVADPASAYDTDDRGGFQMQASVRVMDAGSITWDDHGGAVFRPEDAEFIAAANPATVLELIERVRRSRKAHETVAKLYGKVVAERDAALTRIAELEQILEHDDVAHDINNLQEQVIYWRMMATTSKDQRDTAKARIAEAAKLHRRATTPSGRAVCDYCLDDDQMPANWPCADVRALGLNEGESDGKSDA